MIASKQAHATTETRARSSLNEHLLAPRRVERAQKRAQRYQRLSLLITYLLLSIVAILVLVPFLWLLSASLKDNTQYFTVPIQWIPQVMHWDNYVAIFTQYGFARYIMNSLFLAAYAVVVGVISSSLVGYGFARFHFRGRQVLFIILLTTMMLPSQVTTISLFTTFRDLGWTDTFLPIMVPQLFGSAFSIFLFRQFFLGLPRELDDAARLDGCGAFGIYWRIILPQSRPVLIVVAIFTFLGSWRDAWGPLIYLNSNDNRTLPIGLLFFVGQYNTAYPLLMAATVVALSIPIILYAVGQKYIDSGVAIAEIK